jgi:methylated-DNA-[protein]-cysteine S-methyltransferase
MSRTRAVIPSPVGNIALEAEEGCVIRVALDVKEPLRPPAEGVLEQAALEIGEYFAGRRSSFTTPLRRPAGATPFQHRLWDALEQIPYGVTRTYGDLARELGTSPRAVGGACGRNALPLVIPCHRVVAKGGLGGFSGDWETGRAVDVKRVLLDLEAKNSTGSRPR